MTRNSEWSSTFAYLTSFAMPGIMCCQFLVDKRLSVQLGYVFPDPAIVLVDTS